MSMSDMDNPRPRRHGSKMRKPLKIAHHDAEPRVWREPNRLLAIEAMIAASCRETGLLRSAFSIVVGTVFPWATRKEILAAVDRMIEAGRLVERGWQFDKGRTAKIYVLVGSNRRSEHGA